MEEKNIHDIESGVITMAQKNTRWKTTDIDVEDEAQALTPSEPKVKVEPASANAAALIGEQKIKAPLPGTIASIPVEAGQKVKAGETVIVLEAMKMQNNIDAENDGTVKEICVAQGDTVMAGDVMIVLE